MSKLIALVPRFMHCIDKRQFKYLMDKMMEGIEVFVKFLAEVKTNKSVMNQL